jgi:L-ascorbate metabolism protein UlaG (beta-lactamase superfamily)
MWLGISGGAPSSGFLLKAGDKVALVDPASMISGPSVLRLQQVDVLLFTHEHSDHYSKAATISIQSQTDAVVVANPGVYNSLAGSIPSDKLVKMKSTESTTVSGIQITALAANHLGNEPLVYFVDLSGFRLFHGADSGFVSALSDYKGQAKLAIVPTGGPSPTASPQDALRMVKAIEPTDVIPMHGTETENSQLGTLLAQQLPSVQYVRPEALSSVAVSELSDVVLVVLLSSIAAFSCLVRWRQRPGKTPRL